MAPRTWEVETDETEPVEDVLIDETTPEAPAEEPVYTEPEAEMQPDGAITSADGRELHAPEGKVFVTYTGQATAARLDDIKLEPGVPTLVSKEQSVTLLNHPTETFRSTDKVELEPSADEE